VETLLSQAQLVVVHHSWQPMSPDPGDEHVIIYALTRQVTLAYTVQAIPEQAVAQPRASFTELLQRLGQAPFHEIEAAMAERQVVEPEVGWRTRVTGRLRERVANTQPSV